MSIPINPPPLVVATPRLRLRDLQKEDWTEMHSLRSNPEVVKGLGIALNDEQASRHWLRRSIQQNRLFPRHTYHLAIVLEESGQVIGWIGLILGEPAAPGVNEMGYALNPDYWGAGYMTEAVIHLLECAFQHLGARRIYADCDPNNAASIRVLEKAGLQLEGPVPDPYPDYPGELCLRYSVSREKG